MAYYEDKTSYSYVAECEREHTVNVGWLERGHFFEREQPSTELLTLLWKFCSVSVVQTRGLHKCEFCQESTIVGEKVGEESILLGSAEIRVFAANGIVYAAPTLVYHYVKEHHYKLPDEFIKAMFEGPNPTQKEYFDLLTTHSLEWRETGACPVNSPAIKIFE